VFFVLFVPSWFQKREYVSEVNNVPEIPIYRGNADRAKLPHGYVAEKTRSHVYLVVYNKGPKVLYS